MKLDLHTHCYEATGFCPPTLEIVKRIIDQIKAGGLDGIAITEHWDKNYGFKVKEIVEQFFDNEVLIIPGQEIDIAGRQQDVELYLPNGSIFRFIAHPGYPTSSYIIENVQGIEIENGLHNWHIDKERVKALADKYDLLILKNSDAHSVERIGQYYNEISLEELCARAK
jgi:histidinol phosphatase-like PHP family hydrolase